MDSADNSQNATPLIKQLERKLNYEKSPVSRMKPLDGKEQSISKIANTLQQKLDEKATKLAMLREELTEMANKEEEVKELCSGFQSDHS